MKEFIGKQKNGNSYLNPENWLVRQLSSEKLLLVHKVSGKIREIQLKGGDFL
ncbi:DUF6906 family protein [Enterococcus hirae]